MKYEIEKPIGFINIFEKKRQTGKPNIQKLNKKVSYEWHLKLKAIESE